MLIDRRLAGGALLGVTLAVGTIVGATALTEKRDSNGSTTPIAGARSLLTGTDAVALGCRADEAAVVQHFTFQGERGVNRECVVLSTPWAAAMTQSAVAPPQHAADLAPVATAARTAAPTVRRSRQVDGSSRDGRTWKKTALVIGGSTAAGAGIGGLIGGKKGALIGSAIGGGASTIYESTKRR